MLNDDRNLAPIAPNLDLGAESALAGPFGARRIVYADFTASGRSLPAIEQAIREHVLPTYGNTHTDASHTGATTTRLREEARAAIRRGVNAGDEHAVIFTGSGTTAAVNKLVAMLGLAGPSGDRDRELLRAAVPPAERPVVFVGPFEHHSNELPWREALATVVRLPLDEAGHICLRSLAAALADHAGRPHRYVAISAASNVTGVITETAAVAHVAHKYGARIFVDYAAGGPYLPIDMRGTGQGDHLDAVYFSPHKFLGGPGASGVLVCDRTLHRIARPTMPGGGTVRYVSATQQHYLADVELIEEAGTPAIIGDIRAGLVVQLKSDIGADAIRAAEHSAVARAFRRWGSEPAIEILGPLTATRLPIFSFNITSGGRVLHHNFVVRLLNDLFGIQARGGCSCAGPYGHELLHIGETQSAMYRDLIDQGHELFKPGWVRVGLHFSMSAATQAYILDAVAFIARHGAAFLGAYTPDLHSGLWSASTPRPAAGAESWDRLCAWRGPSAPFAAERAHLMTTLSYWDVSEWASPGWLPRIGSEADGLLLKRITGRPLAAHIKKVGDAPIYAHRIVNNFVKAVDFPPTFQREGEAPSVSPDFKRLYVDEEHRLAILALLNSSVFYWYWRNHGDGFHCGFKDIGRMPVHLDSVSDASHSELSVLGTDMSDALREHSSMKVRNQKKTGRVELQTFQFSPTKPAADAIDRNLGKYHYGFSETDVDYVVNHDIKYRVGQQDDDEGVDEFGETTG